MLFNGVTTIVHHTINKAKFPRFSPNFYVFSPNSDLFIYYFMPKIWQRFVCVESIALPLSLHHIHRNLSSEQIVTLLFLQHLFVGSYLDEMFFNNSKVLFHTTAIVLHAYQPYEQSLFNRQIFTDSQNLNIAQIAKSKLKLNYSKCDSYITQKFSNWNFNHNVRC